MEIKYNAGFIWERRKNLNRCQLKVAYLEVGSFKELNSSIGTDMDLSVNPKLGDLQGDGKVFQGVHAKIFHVLMEKLNFTIHWVQPKKKTYGAKDTITGEWTGLIGLLATKEADVAVLPVSVLSSRGTVIAFSMPFESYGYRLFM